LFTRNGILGARSGLTARSATVLSLALLCLSVGGSRATIAAGAAETGGIQGSIQLTDGTPVGGVSVSIEGARAKATTSQTGTFQLVGLAAGSYDLTFQLGSHESRELAVAVVAGQSTGVLEIVDWPLHFADTLTVYAASRQVERIVEAPAAATVLTPREIELTSAPGQIPKMLEYTVGAEVIQNGLYDFNLNTRGFNTPLSRKVQVVVDGRSPGIPFLSAQEWSVLGFLADDLAEMEFVRGPSAALYGANAFNGVLNLVTQRPSASPGGLVRLTGGELSTAKLNLRWAGPVSDDWHLKVLGEHNQSDDFTRSRTTSVEYAGLDPEVVPPGTDGVESDIVQLRGDREWANGRHSLVLEAGLSNGEGPTFLTSTGRTSITDVERTWSRVNFAAERWNVLAWSNTRKSTNLLLNAGFNTYLDDENFSIEIQGHMPIGEGRGRLVGGASYLDESVDTAGPDGKQTLIAEPVSSDAQALFGQLDYDLTAKLKAVVALRWDDSTLHDAELSPKAALVWSATPLHTLRVSYNQAFDVANYAQLFLQLPAGLPLDLSLIEAALAPYLGGVPLGLGFVPVLAFGNEHQKVERIRSVEVGYNGILGEHSFVTVDYYHNRIEDFLGDLMPGVNPDYPAWQAPSALPAEVAAIVEGTVNGLVPGLTNGPGYPILALSFTNSGEVEVEGVDLSYTYDLDNTWQFHASYSWIDFDVQESAGIAPLPNTAENKYSLGLAYNKDRLAASLDYRWSDDYEWASGVFAGPVPSYGVAGLAASYDLRKPWKVGINVSNLFDDQHYEVFGGDLLRRRALAWVSFTW
jgi:iron complex outermembrane receptor protein